MTGRRWLVAVLVTVFMGVSLLGQANAADMENGDKEKFYNKGKAFTLSPLIGYVFIGDDVDAESNWGGGGAIGYNFNERWGLEYTLIWTQTESNDKWPDGDDDLDVFINNINAVYHFQPEEQLVPYVTAGAGWGKEAPDWGDNDEGFLLDYGAGLKYFVSENIALRGDVRHSHWWNADINDTVTAMVGLTFQIPIPEKKCDPCPEPVVVPPPPPVPAPMPVAPPPPEKCPDGDGDGVCDAQDKCPGTPMGTMVDKNGCPLKMEVHVEFEFDKAVIRPEYTNELAKAALFIKKWEAPVILVAGHTDSIGTEAYNQGLSERRANAVREFLIEKFDIDGSRLVARGYGESQPIASNETDEGRAQNRRVEIICCTVLPEK